MHALHRPCSPSKENAQRRAVDYRVHVPVEVPVIDIVALVTLPALSVVVTCKGLVPSQSTVRSRLGEFVPTVAPSNFQTRVKGAIPPVVTVVYDRSQGLFVVDLPLMDDEYNTFTEITEVSAE